jgi:hypothetical protein
LTSLGETDDRWFSFKSIEGVCYGLNESVRISKGVHKGEVASVIALTSLEPVTYLIELSSGKGDIKILESELERLD